MWVISDQIGTPLEVPLYKRFIVDGIIVRDASIEHLRSTVGEKATIEEYREQTYNHIPYSQFNEFSQALEDAKTKGHVPQVADSPKELSLGFTIQVGEVIEHHTIPLNSLKKENNPKVRELIQFFNLREAWIEGDTRPISATPEDGGLDEIETTLMGPIFYTEV